MLGAPDLAGSALDGRYELHALIGEGAFGRVYRGLRPAPRAARGGEGDQAVVGRGQRMGRALRATRRGCWRASAIRGSCRSSTSATPRRGPTTSPSWSTARASPSACDAGAMPIGGSADDRRAAVPRAGQRASRRASCTATSSPPTCCWRRTASVKVGDFGVARLAGGTSQALSATVAGTPRYMAPEQARGRRTHARHRRLQRGCRAL